MFCIINNWWAHPTNQKGLPPVRRIFAGYQSNPLNHNDGYIPSPLSHLCLYCIQTADRRGQRWCGLEKIENGSVHNSWFDALFFSSGFKRKFVQSHRQDCTAAKNDKGESAKATLLCQACGPLNRHAVGPICSEAHGLISHVSYSYLVLPVPPICNIF